MKRARLVRRTLLALVAAGLLAVTAAGGSYWRWSRAALPVVDGRQPLPGLAGDVTVRRDAYGVPHIRASSVPDLMRAQGYVTAQDRLWQMDVLRRRALGELAEAFGEGLLPADREMRTLGLNRAAREAERLLPPDVAEAMDAYAAGVDAYIQAHPLPLEFRLLRYRPRPWTRVDTLAVGKLLARDLAGGWEQEVYRALYSDRLPADVQAVLYPTRFPDDRILFGHDGPAPPGAGEETARGSNNWVVSGAHTASGKPLLANDPHLGLGVPSIWAAVHLQAPDFDVAGVTLPGAPGVVIGRNRHIAWGCTNVHDDAVDLYAEERDPARPDFFRAGGGWERATVVDEVIRVRTSALGSGLRDVRHPVTITRHGPLVEIHGRLWALRWPGIERSLELTAFLRLDRARNWDEFKGALETYPGPSQNFAYADVEGHIGWYSAGHLPIRASGDGSRPYPGATEEGTWSGFVPFGELPHVVDPPSGRIVTANNRLVGTDYPYVVTRGGIAPWRASAIWDGLEAREGWTADAFAALQSERLSKPHRELADALRAAARRHAGDAGWDAVARDLGAWDGRLEAGSREAALVTAAFRALGERAILPRVAGLPNADRLARRVAAVQVLVRERPASFLPKGDADWDATLLAAWQEGERRLTAQLGADRAQWRYGRTNVMAVRHLLSRAVPGIGALLDPAPREMGSAMPSPNVLQVLPDGQVEGPSMRFIANLADPDDTRLTNFMGQSGHPASPHYGDQLEPWVRVEPIKLPMSEEAVARATVHTLTLTP
ncbi:MAG: penicillin acylase family protein [Vicinamibacteria bacterium]